jgi:hypothetical protein
LELAGKLGEFRGSPVLVSTEVGFINRVSYVAYDLECEETYG